MTTQTLRGLARDYARGTIDKETYRKSRSALIKDIVDGQVTVKAIDYLPPLASPADEITTRTIERDRTEIRPQTKPAPKQASAKATPKPQPVPDKKLPWLFIGVSTTVVIILIITVVLFYPKPPNTTTQTIVQSTNATTLENYDSNVSSAGEDLIGNFLRQKNWNEESLDNFVSQWTALSAEERLSASQTKRMQRMMSSIYKQFLEEKALASIDSEQAISKQKKLIEFASAIGINDSRLVIE